MVRSMYSGVSGLRAHQTALDTIGNNIANVNTNGFKGSRTTFADIYYQSLRGASKATAARGGVNASQVGVGAQVRSVDIMMSRTSFTQTDMAMDVAIDGEGFIQVMDADGNKYYTRAGQLSFDSAGNLVDSKGNFVLGTNGDPFGKAPGSEKIQVALDSVTANHAEITQAIQGVDWTITTTENTRDGNVGVSFVVDTTMPLGEKVKANVTSDAVVVSVNANEMFNSISDFSAAVNDAIQNASRELLKGKDHPAGNFTLTASQTDSVLGFPMSGADIISGDTKVNPGSVSGWNSADAHGFGVKSVGAGFMKNYQFEVDADGDATTTNDIEKNYDFNNVKFEVTGVKGEEHKVTVTINRTYTQPATGANDTITYTGIIPKGQEGSGTIKLTGPGGDTDYIILSYPKAEDIEPTEIPDPQNAGQMIPGAITVPPATGGVPGKLTIKPSEVPKSLGLGSKPFNLEGGTEGGPQGIESMTGVQIGVDGVITGYHNELGEVKIGRIDLATFVNPGGMKEAGGTYFQESPNSGTMSIAKAGEDGSGQLVSGSLELSNVDLAREFTDMIKTQRGYQANSRIITVSDTLLEELVNLKR